MNIGIDIAAVPNLAELGIRARGECSVLAKSQQPQGSVRLPQKRGLFRHPAKSYFR